MQEKTTHLRMFAQQIGLKISQKKTEMMMLKVSNSSLVKVNGEELTTTEDLGSTRWRRQRHRESPQQGQERLQSAKQRLEVIPVQHQDHAKTVAKLRTFHLTARLRMLEDD